jgi:DNA-binding beta-propeller fold protein YncE
MFRAPAVPMVTAIALALAGAIGAAGASSAAASASTPRPPYGYVADSGSADVVPFDTSLKRPGPPIPVTGSPGALVTAPNGQFVYVASTAGVTPIGTDWDKAGRLIAIPGGVAGLVITPDGKRLYGTTDGTSAKVTEVVPVSTVTRTASRPVTFSPGPGSHPSALVITPDGKTVYVAGALGTVTPISTITNKPGRPIPFGPKDPDGTAHLAITPDGRLLYAFVSDPGRTVNTVIPISTAANKAGKPVPVGQGPQAIAFSPDSKTAYVASTGEGPKVLVRAKLTPVSTGTNKPAPFINLGPTATSVYLATTPNGKKVFASGIWSDIHHSGTIFSISTATDTIGKEFFPSFPRAIAFTPDGQTAFIIDTADRGVGDVLSIATATNEFHPDFEVGKVPVAITIAP